MNKPMTKTYTVQIGVDVPAYADVEVKARSQKDAERKVRKQINKNGYNDTGWIDGSFEVYWNGSENLRVVPKKITVGR